MSKVSFINVIEWYTPPLIVIPLIAMSAGVRLLLDLPLALALTINCLDAAFTFFIVKRKPSIAQCELNRLVRYLWQKLGCTWKSTVISLCVQFLVIFLVLSLKPYDGWFRFVIPLFLAVPFPFNAYVYLKRSRLS